MRRLVTPAADDEPHSIYERLRVMKWHEITVKTSNSMFSQTSELHLCGNNLINYNSKTCPSMMRTSNGCTVSFPTSGNTFLNFLQNVPKGTCELHSHQIKSQDGGTPLLLIYVLTPPRTVSHFHVEAQTPLSPCLDLPTRMDLRMEHGKLLRTVLRICLDDETAHKPFLGVLVDMTTLPLTKH